jgi:hypothetical protein
LRRLREIAAVARVNVDYMNESEVCERIKEEHRRLGERDRANSETVQDLER